VILLPTDADFAHPSDLHGVAHVTRVMAHAVRLIDLTGWHLWRSPLLASVYLHDLARTHDGVDAGHGFAAARLFRENRDVQIKMRDAFHIAKRHYSAMQTAIQWHALPIELGTRCR